MNPTMAIKIPLPIPPPATLEKIEDTSIPPADAPAAAPWEVGGVLRLKVYFGGREGDIGVLPVSHGQWLVHDIDYAVGDRR
jgi:hypothetical protein